MVDYTTSEILNEIAKVFPASIEITREGGSTNTADEYAQLKELTSFTLLINNDAIFYLGQLARNRLARLVNREIEFIEDMLVSIDDLSQIGKPVTDTTTLSNADTALLALDAASSVAGRPETRRFSFLMDQFAENYRQNVQSQLNQGLVRPKESAQSILRSNFAELESLHTRVVTSLNMLRDLLDEFESLDIPSKVAAASISRVRGLLAGIEEGINTNTDAENIAASRRDLLTTLTSKVAVDLVGTFTDPRELKFRSPINPIPAGTTHLGRVTGSGVAASVLTSAGPWALPVSLDMSLSANEGSIQVMPLNAIRGAVLNGRNDETFNISSTVENLHIVVDPEVHENEAISASSTTNITLTNFIQLGFKHIGMPVTFLGTPAIASDGWPRLISSMRLLQNGTISAFTPGTNLLSFSSATAAQEPAVGINSTHIGAYVVDTAGELYEVLRIISTSVALSVVEVSVPAGVPNPSIGASVLRGNTVAAGGTRFNFSPATSAPPTGSLTTGPAVKTADLDLGVRTVAQLITDIESEQGNHDPAFTAGALFGQTINRHIAVQAVANEPGRIAIVIRSKLNPYVQISRQFLRVTFVPAAPTVLGASGHKVLGFLEGELDTTDILTPAELVAQLNDLTDIEGSVVTTELVIGTELSSAASSDDVTDLTVDFALAGVAIGDQIEITNGDNAKGTFQITAVAGSVLTVNRPNFISSENGLRYRVFREQVRIASTRLTADSSIRIVSAPSEFGLTVGITYGSIPQFEAVDRLGSLLSFIDVVEGDLLRIVGSSTLIEITAVQDTELTLASGLPSNTKSAGFEIVSDAARQYDQLNQDLTTYTASPNLLPIHNYDENLDEIDNAITAAVIPGLNFASSRNQAGRLLADLLSILTDSPLRSNEYSTSIPTAPDNLLRILNAYDVPSLDVVDDVLDTFVTRKYDRAVLLLQTARVTDFYDTTDESGSFGGAVLASSRAVSNDLPVGATTAFAVDQEQNLAVSFGEVPDADEDFDDIDQQPRDIDI